MDAGMIFIALDNRQIKLLLLKKTLLGQFEVDFFEKKHEVALLENGTVQNVDVLASAIKEGLTNLGANQEKEVTLILPQQSFQFLKSDVPADVAASAVHPFVIDKARAAFQLDLDECYYDYFTKENGGVQVSFFAIEKDRVNAFAETLALLGLKLTSLLPDTLSYFKLFEKTLRAEKKENIFYVKYDKDAADGYVYDSGGLMDQKKWSKDIDEPNTIETVLKEKVEELEQKNQKLNRIILSGEQSEHVRQDTFTKDVGVWTNPLKRIVPNFYDEYVKMLVVPPGKVFPLLTYDMCFGAFIFMNENKNFQLLKKGPKLKVKRASGVGGGGGGFPLFRKEVFIFIAAFAISFFAFVGLTRSNFKFNLPSFTKSTPTPTPLPPTPEPTAIPTPSVKKEDVKIKVQNGSGTVGVAATAKDALKKAGFAEILTENADNFDYKVTEIQVKKSAAGFADDLKKAISDSVTSPKVTDLSDKETSDVIIILGADFK